MLQDCHGMTRADRPTLPPKVDEASINLGEDLRPVIRTLGDVGIRVMHRMNSGRRPDLPRRLWRVACRGFAGQ
jgi:DNA-binding HxlR family transcriptional regulator